MKPAERIKALQARVGAVPDGFWGPKSMAALQRHLRALAPSTGNPWPPADEASLLAYYGRAGDESQLVPLDVSALPVYYDGGKVSAIRCHRLVAGSLGRVLRRIASGPCHGILAHYAGCYNYRAMRGGTRWSLHARGAAIDLDPENNGNMVHWPDAATMPLAIMEEFAREGWLSAGAFWGRDAMHFQATR